MRRSKRLFCFLLAAVTALWLCVPSFAAAGSSDDPLIPESYVTENILPAAKKTIAQCVSSYQAGSVVSLPAGSTVTLSEGQYFVLASGSAKITSLSGSIVNASVGYEASIGTTNRFQRYICCESSTAVITVREDSSAYVSGGAQYSLAKSAVKTLPFTDVSSGAWYYASIKKVYEESIMNGTSATLFRPSDNVTIRTIAQLLYNMSGDTVAVADGSPWYAAAMQWAKSAGVYIGDSGADTATRSDLVLMFYNYASFKGKSMSSGGYDLSSVQDVSSIASSDRTAFAWAFGNGIISGTSTAEVTANPSGTCTRSQMAAIVVNYLNQYGK